MGYMYHLFSLNQSVEKIIDNVFFNSNDNFGYMNICRSLIETLSALGSVGYETLSGAYNVPLKNIVLSPVAMQKGTKKNWCPYVRPSVTLNSTP